MPSIKLKFAHWAGDTFVDTSVKFALNPVAKLSKPITRWFNFSKNSSRFDPMNPATPVISHSFGVASKVFLACSNADGMGASF